MILKTSSILATARRTALVGLAVLAAGQPVRAEVVFEGLDRRQQTNARAYVRLADAPCNTPTWQRKRLIDRAPGQIVEALEALGHYQTSVGEARVDESGDCWRVTLPVDPGPRATYDRVTVAVTGDAEDDAAFRRVLEATPLTKGAPVDHGEYERFKRRLTTLAAERGYFEAKLERNSVVVDEQGVHARVELVIASGPRYRFGEVRYDAPFLDESLLRKFTELSAGDWYDTTALSDTHRALLDTGYFQYVNVDADPQTAVERTIPVVIDVAPAKKRTYSGGLGFATDTGPRFRLNYRNRLINRRGHTLNSELLLSQVHSLLGVGYRIPVGDDRRDVVFFRAGIEDENTDTSETRAQQLSVRYARGRGENWLETFFLEAKRDDFTIGGVNSTSRLIVPGVNWWYLKSKSNPRTVGSSLFLELSGTTQAFGSDTSFFQVSARAKHIRPLSEHSRLHARLHVGATAKDALADLPPSVRFFAGGDRSVRGYDFESLGERNDEGQVIGGSNLITASLEVDWAFNDRWGAALFADSGSAFNGADPEFSSAVGIGLRRASPLGPIRIDFAHPLDIDRSVRLHISFGREL